MAKGGKTPRKKKGSSPSSQPDNYVMPDARKPGALLNPNVPNSPRIGDTVGGKEPLPGAYGKGRANTVREQLPPLPPNIRESNDVAQPPAVQSEPVVDQEGRVVEFGLRKVGERKVKKTRQVQQPGKTTVVYEAYPGGVLSPEYESDRKRINAALDKRQDALPPGARQLALPQGIVKALPPAVQDTIRDQVRQGGQLVQLQDKSLVVVFRGTPSREVVDNQIARAKLTFPGALVTQTGPKELTVVKPDRTVTTITLKPAAIPIARARLVGTPPTTSLVEYEETEDILEPYAFDTGTSTSISKEGEMTQGKFYFDKGRLFKRGR